MRLALAVLPLLLATAPSLAQTREKISTLVVYGNDACPRSSGDEIVVCARQPEAERYRIPKPFRGKRFAAARDGSWAGTAKVLEFTSRQNIPGSCSPAGSWGQTGCFDRFIAMNRVGATIPQ